MPSSIEVTQTMNPAELRSTLNQVNNPVKQGNEHKYNDKISYNVIVSYEGMFRIHHFEILDRGMLICTFKIMGYPKCCGLTILHDFYSYQTEEVLTPVIKHILKEYRHFLAPFVQFVAVRNSIMEYEEYDEEEEEEPEGILVGHETNHNFPGFVTSLIKLTNAVKIDQFVNTNSDNMCEIWQFSRLSI